MTPTLDSILRHGAAAHGEPRPRHRRGDGERAAFGVRACLPFLLGIYAGNVLIETDPITDTLFKLGVLTCIILFVNGSWLVFSGVFASFIRSPKIGRAFNIVMAMLLLVSVALAVKP